MVKDIVSIHHQSSMHFFNQDIDMIVYVTSFLSTIIEGKREEII